MQQTSTSRRAELALILIAALVQAGIFYFLQFYITSTDEPTSAPTWWPALLAVAVFVPVTAQLLAAQLLTRRAGWFIVAIMAAAFYYFGWHHSRAFSTSTAFLPPPALFALWFLLMPFVQIRLKLGAWSADYKLLFAYSWHNTIVLFEASLFTGLFWGLLALWQALFGMLNIMFFKELFSAPLFYHPATTLIFGCAIYLTGSTENAGRVVTVVLNQVLNLFKWLGTVTALLLTLFTLALLPQLPALFTSGNKAISAVWLLWLIAVVVLFLNAAFRDGAAEKPYPKWIALFMRFVIPLMVIVSVTAAWALCVRANGYGLTVDRVWAFVVAGAALLYSVGYAIAAARKGAWFGGIARVNVIVALVLMAVLALMMTPILSPHRLAAESQYNRILAGPFDESWINSGRTPFSTLRYDTGSYGQRKLEELAQLKDHPDAERIRKLATDDPRVFEAWSPNADANGVALAKLRIYPQGRTLDAELTKKLGDDFADGSYPLGMVGPDDIIQGKNVVGIFANLHGDGSDVEDFVLLLPDVRYRNGLVYRKEADGWRRMGAVTITDPTDDKFTRLPNNDADQKDILARLEKGELSVREQEWKDLWIGRYRIRVEP
ncbi:MAG: DUF4153 domain-containing protein [Methylobacillus sp.]|jgi:hypothetical protein|nr:DUF4153 domain-containing protein [Methylobacillus sp.]